MKISTRGRYAIRFMLDLAEFGDGKPVSIKDVSARQDISEKYLEQMVSNLNKAGLVKSIRGPQGGYVLTKNPDEYTIGEILRITEGDMAPVACLEEESGGCARADNCHTLKLWKKLDDAIRDVIDNTSLQDLLS